MSGLWGTGCGVCVCRGAEFWVEDPRQVRKTPRQVRNHDRAGGLMAD